MTEQLYADSYKFRDDHHITKTDTPIQYSILLDIYTYTAAVKYSRKRQQNRCSYLLNSLQPPFDETIERNLLRKFFINLVKIGKRDTQFCGIKNP